MEAWNSFTMRLGYTKRQSVPSTGLIGAAPGCCARQLEGGVGSQARYARAGRQAMHALASRPECRGRACAPDLVPAAPTPPSLVSTAGLLAVLECLPLDGAVHLYGFNWSPENWEGHFMDVEASLVEVLSSVSGLGGGSEQSGGGGGSAARVAVHPTPCANRMRCEA